MDNLVFLEPSELNQCETHIQHGFGVVYIIENDLGKIKIGRSVKPLKRIKAIRSQSGNKIKRICLSNPCSNYGNIEKELHEEFQSDRHIGEWFDINFEIACNRLNDKKINTEASESNREGMNALCRWMALGSLFHDQLTVYLKENNCKIPTYDEFFDFLDERFPESY